MPIYCFQCDDCEEQFSHKLSHSQVDKGFMPKCKTCDSSNVYRDYLGESVAVADGIKTVGSWADRNADQMSSSQKIDIDQKTRGNESPLKKKNLS